MNAPTSASAAYEGSLPAKSAFEHPARIEDSDRSFVTRLASSSVEKLDGLITELKGTVTTAETALKTVTDRLARLDLVVLIDRLSIVLDNLKASFRLELDRVACAFDEMLAAIPGGGEVSASASI